MVRAILKPFNLRIVIRRYEAILVGSVMLLSGAVMPSSWEIPFRFYPAPNVELPPPHPWIALTFDDGPHPGMTERLLNTPPSREGGGDLLYRRKDGDRYPQLVRSIARNGHEVANHTYSHPNLSRLPNEAILRELSQTRAVIRRLTGVDNLPLPAARGGL